MTMFPAEILVAVDFGEASASAIAAAGELAAHTGAHLSLLHAETLDVPPYFTSAQLKAIEGEERANLKRAGEYLAQFGRRHTPQPFQVIIESRAAAEAILHASKHADLVVMGTHGRRGPSRWWLGSVADRVLQEISTPLLVVHSHANPPSQMFARGLLLLAPGAASEATRRIAGAIAASVSGSLTGVVSDDAPAAKARVDATWAAVPVPVPRTADWRSQVGAPMLQSCAIPVLFVPEADGGPAR